MGYEVGIGKWLSMSPKEQEEYLLWAEGQRAKELETLTYEEAAKQLFNVLRWGASLPFYNRPDTPCGVGSVIDPSICHLGLPPEPVAKTYRFLENTGNSYLITGGVASRILGEPCCLTANLSAIVYVRQENLPTLLMKAKADGFQFDEHESLENAKKCFCFRMQMGFLRVDCMVATTTFETEILSRSLTIPLVDYSIRIPSPEDLILMKLIAYRDQDVVDIKNIALRNRGKLDVTYMRQWAEAWHRADSQSQILSRLEKLLEYLKQIP
ncbi:MAG: hypothetical protein HY747_08520 [Elusimicrobia bacterium]|nr:hypothetical protein [Elusimicrobiota bacterium]